ncbi:MAG: hypothetical protein LUH58_09605 [Lachnospiraceae bacterium]|nr:hypothetical protein [Lachnospiraceae bacterium]
MKKTKKFSKLLALVLAVVMMVGMAVTASADDSHTNTPSQTNIPYWESNSNTLTIQKTLYKRKNVYTPNVTFNFEITPASDVVEGTDTYDGELLYNGISSAISASTTIAFSSDIASLSETSVEKYANIPIDVSKFSHAGVYKYQVKESTASGDQYEGISYDNNTYDLYIFVVYDTTSRGYKVLYTIMSVSTTKYSGLTNTYGVVAPTDPSQDPTPNGTVNDLIITKVTTGAYGDVTEDFKFNVSVNGGTGNTSEKYYYEVGTYSTSTNTFSAYLGTEAENGTITSNSSSVEINLKNTEAIKIYGLSENDIVEITEIVANSNGYTTVTSSTGVTTLAGYSSDSGSISGKVNTDNQASSAQVGLVTFTNTKNSITPTGVILTYGPYAAMVVIALGACVVFFRKRRSTID